MQLTRLLSILPFLALSAFSSTSAQTTREEFAAAAAKNGGIVKLNTKSFDALIGANREWSSVVQLTAMGSKFNCKPCREFGPVFEEVAASWSKAPKKERDGHFFATLDFSDGQEVFRRLGLNSAPFVNFYPAKKGPFVQSDVKKQKDWSYDFNRNLFDPETLARELSAHTPIPIKYSAPIDYTPYVSAFITTVIIVVGVVFFGSALKEVFFSPWVWGVFSLGIIVTMISGYMFTRIRNVPFAQPTKNGMNWIAQGYQNQYGAETQVVGGLYSVLALSQVALIIFVPRIPTAGRQKAAVFIWSTVLVMIFSVLLALFRQKNAGYPFKLLL